MACGKLRSEQVKFAEILVAPGKIGLLYPHIKEVDINPMILTASVAVAVDATIILLNHKQKNNSYLALISYFSLVEMSMISKLRVPPGVFTLISSPIFLPMRALPIGDVTEILF